MTLMEVALSQNGSSWFSVLGARIADLSPRNIFMTRKGLEAMEIS